MGFRKSSSLFVRTAVRAFYLVIAGAVLLYASDYLFDQTSVDNGLTIEDSSSRNGGVERNSTSVKRAKDYALARRVFWQELYPREFETLYCGDRYNARPNNGVNIEHVFPMGWVTNSMNCGTRKQCRGNPLFDQIESDLHNLYPSRSVVNKARSSFRFGELSGEAREFGQRCDFEVSERRGVAEPREEIRGDLARAMFYMVDQYDHANLEIYAKQRALLKKWHKSDPPSAEERARNDRIERLQGNRNPYVDFPDTL